MLVIPPRKPMPEPPRAWPRPPACAFGLLDLLVLDRLPRHEEHDEEPGTEDRQRNPEHEDAVPGERTGLEEVEERRRQESEGRPEVEVSEPAREDSSSASLNAAIPIAMFWITAGAKIPTNGIQARSLSERSRSGSVSAGGTRDLHHEGREDEGGRRASPCPTPCRRAGSRCPRSASSACRSLPRTARSGPRRSS